jgi:hypothetical protein
MAERAPSCRLGRCSASSTALHVGAAQAGPGARPGPRRRQHHPAPCPPAGRRLPVPARGQHRRRPRRQRRTGRPQSAPDAPLNRALPLAPGGSPGTPRGAPPRTPSRLRSPRARRSLSRGAGRGGRGSAAREWAGRIAAGTRAVSSGRLLAAGPYAACPRQGAWRRRLRKEMTRCGCGLGQGQRDGAGAGSGMCRSP